MLAAQRMAQMCHPDLEARVVMLEAAVAFREARVQLLERRLGEKQPRRPYPALGRLRILRLAEYYQIPKRCIKETLGVARSSA